jgi:hypothetical protein
VAAQATQLCVGCQSIQRLQGVPLQKEGPKPGVRFQILDRFEPFEICIQLVVQRWRRVELMFFADGS